jgi:hypothetical protein
MSDNAIIGHANPATGAAVAALPAGQKRRDGVPSGMLARSDSFVIPGPSAASAAAFPAWARALHPPESEAEAGFLAGAGLARSRPAVASTRRPEAQLLIGEPARPGHHTEWAQAGMEKRSQTSEITTQEI